MKSSLRSDEICFADEIKSVPTPDKVGFHHKVISSTKGGFIPSARTDLTEKHCVCLMANTVFFMAERMGFEPMAPCGVTGFQDQLLKPLGHLSIPFLHFTTALGIRQGACILAAQTI